MVALETIVVRTSRILGASVGDETLLMSVEKGEYYALSATSRAIWERLKAPVRVRDLCLELAESYEAPLETVEIDTLEFLTYLAALKLIESPARQDPSVQSD